MNRCTRETREACYNSIIRRMVNLPRTLLGNFSRAVNEGIYLINPRTRRNQNQNQNQNQHLPFNFHTPYLQEPVNVQENWVFLATFEQKFSQFHPFFYACRFSEALKIAENEHKLLFVYLHSPEHPFVSSFCKETLCSELVVQYVDTNFVSWGGLTSAGEGLHLASTLQALSFPFCAVVAPASGDNLAVLQQIEGPVSHDQLVEILQRTLEEQGLAFGSTYVKEEEENKRIERQLREDQDAAYLAALSMDQEKERLENFPSEDSRSQKQKQPSSTMNNDKQKKVQTSDKETNDKSKQNLIQRQVNKLKESISKEAKHKDATSGSNSTQITQVLIRFPDGNRKEHKFVLKDKIQAIYTYIDSLNLLEVGNYQLISNFPRKVFGVDQMRMTLKDAGLYPKATLFVEML